MRNENSLIDEWVNELQDQIFPETIDFLNAKHKYLLYEIIEKSHGTKMAETIINNIEKVSKQKTIDKDIIETKDNLSKILNEQLIWDSEKSSKNWKYFVVNILSNNIKEKIDLLSTNYPNKPKIDISKYVLEYTMDVGQDETITSFYAVLTEMTREADRGIVIEFRLLDNVLVSDKALQLINEDDGTKKEDDQQTKAEKIKRIVEKISKGDYTDEILDKIEALVSINKEDFKLATNFLVTLHIPEQHAKAIIKKAYAYKNPEKFFNYLKNRTVTLENLLTHNNIFSAFEETKIDVGFLKWLFEYRWPTTPLMGQGEVALSILLQNASKSITKGDVIVADKEIEVKGEMGRLRGQKNFGMGLSVASTWERMLKRLSEKYQIADVVIPKAGGSEYNLTGDNWALEKVGSELIQKSNGKITKDDIADIWQSGFESLFIVADFGWIKNYINDDGTITDKEKFKFEIIKENIKYYMQVEDIDLILVVGKTGKFGFVDYNKVDDDLAKKYTFNMLSFTNGAGPQGSVVSLKLK